MNFSLPSTHVFVFSHSFGQSCVSVCVHVSVFWNLPITGKFFEIRSYILCFLGFPRSHLLCSQCSVKVVALDMNCFSNKRRWKIMVIFIYYHCNEGMVEKRKYHTSLRSLQPALGYLRKPIHSLRHNAHLFFSKLRASRALSQLLSRLSCIPAGPLPCRGRES